MRSRTTGMSSAIIMMAALSGLIGSAEGRDIFSIEEKEPPIPKGHSRFVINGVVIYALNRRNAEKKYSKLHV